MCAYIPPFPLTKLPKNAVQAQICARLSLINEKLNMEAMKKKSYL